MGRNRIGLIIAAVVVVLLLLWLFGGLGNEVAETAEGVDVEAPDLDAATEPAE